MRNEMHKLGSSFKDVPLKLIKVSTEAQRRLRAYRVTQLASQFDAEMFGNPVVNYRGGHYYVVDGQHRVEAVKEWLGKGWENQSVTCRVYTGLSEKEEAAMYLRLNNQLPVNTYDRFKVAVTAGEPAALAIKAAVHHAGLQVGPTNQPGVIAAVSTLGKVYARSGGKIITRALLLVNEAFGDPGLVAPVIDGVARVCERYNSALNDHEAVEILSNLHGGVGSLLTKAANYRKTTGNQPGYCFAGALVDALNAKSKKRLPSWWREEK